MLKKNSINEGLVIMRLGGFAMEKEYKAKSYKLFIIWMIGFMGFMVAEAIICKIYFPEAESGNIAKIILLGCLLAILVLFFIIYKTENIYWINGISYEDAKISTSEKRKKFAMRILKIFFKATIIFSGYCLLSSIINTSIVIDTIIFIVIIIVAAIKTIPIKL